MIASAGLVKETEGCLKLVAEKTKLWESLPEQTVIVWYEYSQETGDLLPPTTTDVQCLSIPGTEYFVTPRGILCKPAYADAQQRLAYRPDIAFSESDDELRSIIEGLKQLQ